MTQGALQQPTLGLDLLPQNLARDRDKLLTTLAAAYYTVLQQREANFALWHGAKTQAAAYLRAEYKRLGLEAAPFVADAFWRRLEPALPTSHANEHLQLIGALLTPYNARFCEHIQYRLRTGGNVHLQIRGPTGMGKSSGAISIADWIKTIEPAAVIDHLSFDLSDLPGKLANKTAGQSVIQDEFLQMAGDGARTVRAIFENLEDTLRASQVNLIVLSPRRQEHGTMQAELELVLWCPSKRFSLFLVWLDGTPHGVIAIPWARDALWTPYLTWKKSNTGRSLSGHFRDNTYLARAAMRAFADNRLVNFICKTQNKPKPRDFGTAFQLFFPEMNSSSQGEQIYQFMHNLAYNYERLAEDMEAWWGVQPNEGLKRVAAKCYPE